MTRYYMVLALIVLASCRDTRTAGNDPRPTSDPDFAGQWAIGDPLFPQDSVHMRLERVGNDSLSGTLLMQGTTRKVSGKIDGQTARIDFLGTDLVFLGKIHLDTLSLNGVRGAVPHFTFVRASPE